MRTFPVLRAGAAVVVALMCFAALAAPASADLSPYDVTMESGRLSIGTQSFDTPGSGATGCTPPAVEGYAFYGALDDDPTKAGDMNGALSIDTLFNVPAIPPFYTGGNFGLLATGTATGASSGDYDPATGTFSQLRFTNVSFTIRTVTSCAMTTTVVCSGTASLTASGGLYNAATLPLGTSEKVYVNVTGTVVTRGTCALPFTTFVTAVAAISLGDNPNDDVAPSGTDPGALFHQV